MSFLPKKTLYIIGNEACERFGFYGMRSILILFMMQYLDMLEEDAMSVMHLFIALVYLTPLLGAWLADKVLGRYHTILYVSVLYCFGFFTMALAGDLASHSIEISRWVMYAGLFIIGLGSGGIKPCVSAFMGDQIADKTGPTMTRAYNAFYWSINLGSFAAFLIIPFLREIFGPAMAFTIPGLFMALATFILYLGRDKYTHIPPNREKIEHGFWTTLISMMASGSAVASEKHGETRVDEVKRVLRIISIFVFVIPFWALFDQTASSWVIQGKAMTPFPIETWWGVFTIGPEQIQAANPAFIMILIPVISVFIYPYIGRFGKPLFRMGSGIFLSGVAFAIVAWLQYRIESGETLGIEYQIIPYLILTVGEILLSTTGLEFAYTQAPATLKSVITSFWNLTIFLGNMLVVAITAIVGLYGADNQGKTEVVTSQSFLIYAGIAIAVTALFALSARFYAKNA